MNKIEYKNLLFDKVQIKNLYLDNEWYAYTNDEERLYRGILNSTDCIGAYDDELLVGLIRTVSDGETICYIQDILILKEYQRKGIGKELMKLIFDQYTHVRQVVLMTDNNEKTRSFYENIGMVSYDKVDGVGFILKRK
jgi:ribosomal protein S18 acetylase RimI-like enzyme